MLLENGVFLSGIYRCETMKKWKTFGMSLLPVCLWLLLQIMLSAGFSTLLVALSVIFKGRGGSEDILRYLQTEGVYILSCCINGIFLVPGIFWYRFLKKKEENKEKSKMDAKVWLRLLILGLCLQMAVSLILFGAQVLFPEIMEDYGQVMESLGVNQPSIWSALYVGIFAPVTEELIFRGLTLKILFQSFSFPVANVIQALYFALVHGNLVQGLYAFGIGLVLGNIVEKHKTLKGAVACHFVVNVSGLLLGSVSLGPAGMAVGVVILVGILVLLRDRKK